METEIEATAPPPDSPAAGGRLHQACCELDVWESLIVRACKCNRRSVRRFKRIIGMRCALELQYVGTTDVTEFLVELIEKFQLKTLSQFVREIHPSARWKFGKTFDRECDDPTDAHLLSVAVSIIRLTEVRKLPGYRSPTRFAKRHNDKNQAP